MIVTIEKITEQVTKVYISGKGNTTLIRQAVTQRSYACLMDEFVPTQQKLKYTQNPIPCTQYLPIYGR